MPGTVTEGFSRHAHFHLQIFFQGPSSRINSLVEQRVGEGRLEDVEIPGGPECH